MIVRKILVTGSNGFIGGHILRELNRLGYDVYGCGRGVNKNPEIPYLVADLSQGIQSVMDFDLIIHAAARSPEASFDDYFTHNVIGTQNVLDFARSKDIGRIVYLSSVSTFGRIEKVLSEDSPHNDPDDYGLSKYVAEKLIRDSELNYDVYILPGVIGEGCRKPYIIRLAESLYHERDVYCYNSNGMFNNVILVSDMCKFLVQRLEEKAKDIFLLGCSEQIRVRDVVSLLAENFNSQSKIEFSPEIRGGFYLDIRKALKAGFTSATFSDIIQNICSEIKK